MGHVTRYGVKVDTSDFRKFWHGTVAYNRDGCSSIYIIPFHKGKCTDSVIKRFFKQKENRGDPNSYCVNAYDCGIKGYESVRVVSRIVNHKRTKVLWSMVDLGFRRMVWKKKKLLEQLLARSL